MYRSARAHHLLVAAGLAAAASLGPLAERAHAGPAAPVVPGGIAVEAGNKPFLVGHAAGVQIYTCNATPGGFAWSAATPRAELRDDNGKLILTHFAGPSWQANDGSVAVGQRVNGVTVDPTAIPWLLLRVVSTSEGLSGDRLAATTFIQRINTTGGLTPATSGCNATTVGRTAEVPYTADYWFWKKTGH
jgi:hypothetical protein